jgi:hypothetical protein
VRVILSPESDGQTRRIRSERRALYDARVNAAAKAFFGVVCARGKYFQAGREFLEAAENLNRQDIIECAIERFASGFPKADAKDVRRAIRNDFARLFDWHDLSDLKVGGHA